jgi:hypothetical protein
MRQGIRKACLSVLTSVCLLMAWGALPAQATTLTAELSASKEYRALALLGDVELRKDTTFLTFGYSGVHPGPDTALTHQLSLGVDHALSDHWLISGSVLAGLPKNTFTPLAREFPRLGLPSLGARTSYNSQGLALSAGYDSAGLSDVEYGLDVGLGLTRYPLRRALISKKTGEQAHVVFQQEEKLGVLRPSVGGRLLLGSWELSLRGGFYLYNEDPLSAGQFSEQEQQALAERYAQVAEDRNLQRLFLQKLYQDIGTAVATRLGDANFSAGLPSAPARFDVRPSVTYRFSSTVRGQLSYAFTQYVPGQGLSHLLATRWTVRLGEPVRLWASVALQADMPEEPSGTVSTGLATLGAEYTF